MEFNKRLEKAIERGQQTSDARKRAQQKSELSEEDYRRMHSEFRLPLSEQIESCLEQLPSYFPGFQYSTVVNDRGWGAAVSRDDVGPNRKNLFSRLEMLIRPYSSYHVLELTAKGTIRNKEVYNRTHFQRLAEADPATFAEMIDLWVLEYAELYAAKA